MSASIRLESNIQLTRRLLGLTSACTTPRECTHSRASAASRAHLPQSWSPTSAGDVLSNLSRVPRGACSRTRTSRLALAPGDGMPPLGESP